MGQAKCGQADGSWLNMLVGEGSLSLSAHSVPRFLPFFLQLGRQVPSFLRHRFALGFPQTRDAHALASGGRTPPWPTPGFTPSVFQNAVPDALRGFRQLAFLFLSFSVVILHQGKKMRRI